MNILTKENFQLTSGFVKDILLNLSKSESIIGPCSLIHFPNEMKIISNTEDNPRNILLRLIPTGPMACEKY
jgi:hypothetical protein